MHERKKKRKKGNKMAYASIAGNMTAGKELTAMDGTMSKVRKAM